MAQKDKPQKEAGANRQELLNAMEAAKHPRVDTRDVQAIEQRINEYLKYCIDNDVSASVAGCANWLGVNIRTLEGWYTGYRGTPEHQRTAARLYGILQDVWAQKMDGGRINPVSGIFMSKVFYGYRDQQEIIVQDGKSQSQLSVADLIAESKRLPGAENLSLTDGAQTIEADYKVIEAPTEDDVFYEKAAARQRRKEERQAASIANQPKQKAAKKEYLKNYFQEHKEEYNERHRAYRKRDAEKKAQN